MYKARTDEWYLERVIFTMGGVMVLISMALTLAVSKWWLILTSLVGVNLLMFGITGFCIMASIMAGLGVKPLLARAEAPREE